MSVPGLVSIIIPTYNRAGLIVETLGSIRSQTYSNWECIVVDDGSSDETASILTDLASRDSRFRFYRRPSDRPKGANACRNYGFEQSKGEFVNWFDSDDLMHEQKLELQVQGLETSDFPFSVCQSLVFEGNRTNILGLKHHAIASAKPFDDFVRKEIIWLTQAPVFRRAFLSHNGFRFNESLQAAQEWEFFARILMRFPDYHAESQPLVLLRHHQDSISSSPERERLRQKSYLLARKTVYELAMRHGMSRELERFFVDYFHQTFKTRLQSAIFGDALAIYLRLLLPSRLLKTSDKIRLFTGLISYGITGKGNRYMQIDSS